MGTLELNVRDDIPLSDRVYLTLKKAIIRGELHPGYRLIILDIADTFGVSQAPVREAIERLKHEGLLTSVPNRGSMVSNLTMSEMREVYDLRMVLESYVLTKTLSAITSDDIQTLTDIFEKMSVAADNDSLFEFIDLDMEFHGWFYHKYGNQQIISVWNVLKEKIARFTSVTNQLYYADLKALARGHIDLIRILQTNDNEQVKAAYMKHIQGVWGAMKSLF